MQSKGFTVVLDMRGANWSQAKKALEALKVSRYTCSVILTTHYYSGRLLSTLMK